MIQRQTTIFDILEELEKLDLNTLDIDETPTEVCLPDEPIQPESTLSLIEQVITSRLELHLRHRSIPSLDEAKAIILLDSILGKYNA